LLMQLIRTSTASSKLTMVLIMNAEYLSHKRVWEMVKPHAHEQLPPGPASTLAPASADLAPEFFGANRSLIDPAVLSRGHVELRSPLSDW
jgi:hypothetical protein